MYGLIVLMMAVGAHAACPDAYQNINSSLCLADSTNLIASKSGVSASEQTEIVNHHNDLRRNVSVAAGTPAHMPELTWDAKIAAVAQQWAQSQCALKHDTSEARAIPDYPYVTIGQNGASASTSMDESWTGTIDRWYSEEEVFVYNVNNGAAGHFTQVVSDKATRIGCGRAACTNGMTYSYCNYATGQSSYGEPFELGARASGCGKFAENGLCSGSCAGLLCYNHGSVNYATCTCSCSGSFSGTHCDTNEACSQDDYSFCTNYDLGDCSRITNLADFCPHLCATC